MNLTEMNKALQWLRDKYAVKADGTLVASAPDSIGADASLKLENGTSAALLPWRPERRFIELEKLLYRELDLCEYLGESPIVSTFAVISGKTANVIVKLADGKSCSVECSGALPPGTEEMDRHEIIARRGIACDRVVDTQVPQSSIYQFTANGEKRYTDTDTELFGFSNAEILLIRAAFEVLRYPELVEVWNKADARLLRMTEETLATEKNAAPAHFAEEK